MFTSRLPASEMNTTKPAIIIVIPVFNHGNTVFEVIDRCMKIHDRILVVNDGSTDLDMDKVSRSPVDWIHHTRNMGKGAAIMTAARIAKAKKASHIITIDADMQHDPEDIALFKTAVYEKPDVLFIGKRDFETGSVPGLSRFGRQFSNFWFRIQTGFKIGDAQSGFRAYPLFLFERLSFSQNHYAFEVEILVKTAWAGIIVKDLDISVHYPSKGTRISHFQLFWDNLRLTRLNTVLTLRSFLPVPHKKIIKKGGPHFSVLSPVKSIRQVLSYNLSPFEIAMAGAVGVFLGTLPLIAMHLVAILFVTGFFRLNKWVAIGTSHVCVPPFVPAICIEVGYFMTHRGQFLTEFSLETIGYQAIDRLFEWLLGSLIVAPLLGIVTFAVIYVTAHLLSTADQEQG